MTKITPLPKPPTTQDSLNFDIRADEFLESLPKFAEELNAFGANINNVGTEVDNKLSEAIIRGKEAIKSATNEGINSINSAADKRKKSYLQSLLSSQIHGKISHNLFYYSFAK